MDNRAAPSWRTCTDPTDPHSPTAMRLVARFVLLLTLVLGVSLGFAWAWDRADGAASESGLSAR